MIRGYLDIEVRPSCLDTEQTPNPVVCASIYKPHREVITFGVERANIDSVDVGGKKYRVRFIHCASEKTLLSYLFSMIRSLDYLMGWNISGFDLPYLFNRARRLGIDISLASPLDHVYRSGEGFYVIEGVNVIDLQLIYSRVGKSPLYTSLQYVAMSELGIGKLYDKTMLDKISFSELARYNAVDTILTYLIDSKLRLSDFAIELSREAFMPIGGPIHSPSLPYASQLVDNTLLHYARSRGIVLPSKISSENEGYEGAIVFEPKTGIHDDVLVMDYSRLYPSIIINFNISPETISLDKPLSDDYLEFTIGGKRVFIRQDVRGLVPAYLEDLFRLRDKYEKMMEKLNPGSEAYRILDSKRYVIKQIINAVYGQFSFRSRIHNIHAASLITKIERQILNLTRDIANKLGFKVLYGDTDSIFVNTNGSNDYEGIASRLTSLINSTLGKIYGREFSFRIKAEKHFSRLLLFKKKRYVGLIDWADGKRVEPPSLEVKGFEVVRSDTPILAKKALEEFFMLLLREGGDIVKLGEWLRRIREEFMNAKPELIAIPCGIRKTNYAVDNIQAKALRFIERTYGIKLNSGARIFWAYTRGNGIIAVPEDLLEDINKYRDKIDYDRMFERNIKRKISDLLNELLGIRLIEGQMRLF